MNQEFISMAHASKAILPRDKNGPWGQRIGVGIGGSLSGKLRVGAYVTGRATASDWSRYALVVVNRQDTDGNGWNPQPVKAGTYSVNQEFISMAHASKAILPRDKNGPWGQRIGVGIGGSLSGKLRVGAYVTGRATASDWSRYALVVVNRQDTDGNGWNPQPVKAGPTP